MEDNKELVEETENVEETTEETLEEETPEEEPIEEIVEEESEEDRINRLVNEKVNEILPKKMARKEAKLRKEFTRKYGRLETVVNAGLETNNIDEAVEKLTDFYTKRGINIPSEPQYSDRDIEVLANAEAEDIMSGGYDDIVDEVDRLASIGADNMTQRDKLIFVKLSNERKRIEDTKELATIGVNVDDLDDDFNAYAERLNPNLSLKEKYEMYLEHKPKKETKQIGSMKGVPESRKKDYYTPEEISKLSEEDLDDPEIWEAVRKSMTGQN
ncbi:MAG: hypothetical protein II625_06585 [Bacilli bacterium]|nr:hypothetical protein [Bacilli bacterium]